ncbi:dTDP-4-dehydrorhamnose reductase [Candidatus Contubernalis alkalaceticus]|uniref:dTDP-4-dehydrorhamnose reductase n=1 Tax=Candidatus Contubernalis alkaliaceticus TaxID=338645 RepID=UPI0029621A47|nr:dTDP-4-dehydrorhamnose reductase [Candidatus Contubernalis alkalaceticus]UNC93476.1 dTDP-4-dehydrorhamnose reductase [Candidatus Contubernalis alkalaceticus]
MKITGTRFKGLLIVETDVYGDNRGWFTETFTKNKFIEKGMDIEFVQDNHSYSAKKNTLRGIHFQNNPEAQTKIIRCTRGSIADIVVDLRKGSETYKQWLRIELSAHNKKQLFIPKGFGHGFLTLTDDCEVQYKVDRYYSIEHDRGIKYNDPEIGIEWGVKEPILSRKDLLAPLLKNSDVNYSIKVMVTGASGQLGLDVVKRLKVLGIEAVGVSRDVLNITDKKQTEDYIITNRPDVVIHCAAYTKVDQAEDEKEHCYLTNVEGTRNIAQACSQVDAKMVYISTDYVFDGEGESPHREEKSPGPINFYGYSKVQGEAIVKEALEKYYIVRTSWLYGHNGNNFVKKILKLAQSRDEINVVNDQIGSPTYTEDLSVLICDMIQTNKYGIYHGVNEGYCSWYQFALAVFGNAGIDIKVNPISSSKCLAKAERPLNSRLSTENTVKNGFQKLPQWEGALVRFLTGTKV